MRTEELEETEEESTEEEASVLFCETLTNL